MKDTLYLTLILINLIITLIILIFILTLFSFGVILLLKKGSDDMKKVISRCPVCNNELTVVRLKCDSCDTVIENNFKLTKFDYLSDEELYFTETFIRCRGNIKEVEKELGISYPTVRSKLDAVIKKLGYETITDEHSSRKEEILKALENGEITAEQAIAQLK